MFLPDAAKQTLTERVQALSPPPGSRWAIESSTNPAAAIAAMRDDTRLAGLAARFGVDPTGLWPPEQHWQPHTWLLRHGWTVTTSSAHTVAAGYHRRLHGPAPMANRQHPSLLVSASYEPHPHHRPTSAAAGPEQAATTPARHAGDRTRPDRRMTGMTHPTEQVATVATTQRLEQLLQADVPGYPAPGGYLDTLPGEHPPAPGRAQAAWQTGLGATLYQHLLQPTMARLLMPPAGALASQLGLEAGHTVADVGCGPGNITTTLADAVGPHGLAIGVDRSAPMLERAATQARPTMGLLRADATQLPLETASVDAACATAVVMLVPEPAQALAELLRIVKPGGPVLVMVPGRGDGFLGSLTRQLGQFGGARLFTPDELAILLEQLGCGHIHTERHGTMPTARTRAPQQANQAAAPSTPPNTAGFDAIYRGDYRTFTQPGTGPGTGFELDRVPWDIGEAQSVVRDLEAAGAISSEVLDIGCGPGDNALYLAERQYRVCALDGAPAAIEIARRRAKTRQLSGTMECPRFGGRPVRLLIG